MARSAELETSEDGQELKKQRVVALQILVIVAEYANSRDLPKENAEASIQFLDRLNNKIFIEYSLFALLMNRCLTTPGDLLTIDEIKLAARSFASVPPEILISQEFLIFEPHDPP